MTTSYRIRQLAVTESTNADAKSAAEAGEAEGLVVWALKQTAGKGRHGRAWESPEGNLYASILLRPDCEARQGGHYGFAAALAVHDVVQALLPNAAVTLKWPNDVLADGKKISGILLEAAPAKNGKLDWLIAGIGLNVAHHPETALYPTTSLAAAGITALALPDMLNSLLENFSYWQETLENQGFSPLCAAWLACAQKGRLSVRQPDGVVEGAFAGLGEDGSLVLQLADGSKQAIAAGEIAASS